MTTYEIRVYSEFSIEQAVNASCTCGGKGPEDPKVCPACMVWHRLTATPRPPPQTAPSSTKQEGTHA